MTIPIKKNVDDIGNYLSGVPNLTASKRQNDATSNIAWTIVTLEQLEYSTENRTRVSCPTGKNHTN